MNSNTDRRVSRAIVIQVVVVSALALVMLVLAVTDIVEGTLGLGWAVGGLLGGAVVGVLASRTKRMQWDERTGQVLSTTDWLGGVILVCFLVAQLDPRSLGRRRRADTLGLCVSAGTLAGQVLGTRRAVRAVRQDSTDR